MTRHPQDALASQFEQYRVEKRLHDVPPHTVYEVTVDGRRAVCKVADDPEADPAVEAAVLGALDERTSVAVPSVLATGTDWFVATWLDGLPSECEAPSGDDIDTEYARALGRVHARLHAETADWFDRTGFLETGDRLTLDERSTWRETILALIEHRRVYLEKTGYAKAAEAVIDLFEDRPELLPADVDPVLCHGNLLPAHVGFQIEDGVYTPTGVIDFEHTLVGPAAWDLWRTALPVFAPPGTETTESAFDAFREGYEEVRPLPVGFERDRRAYLLVNLVSYLRSLDLQNHGIGPDERKRAETMVESILETVEAIRVGR